MSWTKKARHSITQQASLFDIVLRICNNYLVHSQWKEFPGGNSLVGHTGSVLVFYTYAPTYNMQYVNIPILLLVQQTIRSCFDPNPKTMDVQRFLLDV